jgi:hypothetical protein
MTLSKNLQAGTVPEAGEDLDMGGKWYIKTLLEHDNRRGGLSLPPDRLKPMS